MISLGIVKRLIDRAEADQFSDEDVTEFFLNPRLWRTSTPGIVVSLESAQALWQGVWDELGVRVEVPPVPKLTDGQVLSLKKFGFLPVYFPAITEEQYPAGFVKPAWETYLAGNKIERLPLSNQWVAVETIAKPHYDNPWCRSNDRLMAAVRRKKRFAISHDALTGYLLVEISEITGFQKKDTRLASVEEWNLVANLFTWLRDRRWMDLPDLSSDSWEWCQNAYNSDFRLLAGRSGYGGLAGVHEYSRAGGHELASFRVILVL